ncbi:SRPBCC family protein [Xanthobacter flavus]|uniref:aromatic ring-hydroxylating oxygenase subunit alpha n=1 Tax=Xanthobacter flavus TaxID=281 RepID=UPI00372A5F86
MFRDSLAPAPTPQEPARPVPSAGQPAEWVRAAIDPAAFTAEQQALGRVWTFLCLDGEVAQDGQWFRTDLGGRSVFIQRFGDRLRGFENVCAHRFHPIRRERSGKGAMVCAFHHWRYNAEGQALGIPVCDEAYGCLPKQLNAHLKPIEVEAFAGLVFGRFPDPDGASLADFLGDAAPMLAALCPPGSTFTRFGGEVPANWKFLTHVTLDDYHIVAVHPSTFGANGYLKAKEVTYARFGRHSAYTTEPGDDPLAGVLADCRTGTYRARDYLIVNLFPTFGASQFHTIDLLGRSYYSVMVLRYAPLAHDRSRLEGWLIDGPIAPPRPGLLGVFDRFAQKMIARIVPFFARRVLAEDNAVCEGQQSVARQITEDQRLSPAFEKRIGWFEETYAAEVSARSPDGEHSLHTGEASGAPSRFPPQ